MAYQLKVADVLAIRALVERGWSYRRIARELSVHRHTVARYARGEDLPGPKPTKAPTGSDPPGGAGKADLSGSGRESVSFRQACVIGFDRAGMVVPVSKATGRAADEYTIDRRGYWRCQASSASVRALAAAASGRDPNP
jgi:hypothetical protein